MTTLAQALAALNNPGAVTATSDSDYIGQTGTYSPGNGLTYATFDNPTDGLGAIAQWLNNNTGTNPALSYTTVGEAGNAYTGSNTGGAQWAQILGTSPSTPISMLTQDQLLQAAITNEGVGANGLSINANSSGAANGVTPTSSSGTSSSGASSNSASGGSIFTQFVNWALGGLNNVIFVVIGIILLIGAVMMFAKEQGVELPSLPPVPIPA